MADKAKELRERVQKTIVDIISTKLQGGEMTEERAKQIASMVLEKLPEDASYNELMKIIPKLDDHFHELTQAVMPIMVEYERKMKEIVDKKISDLISKGQFDKALDVAKKAIEFEKELS